MSLASVQRLAPAVALAGAVLVGSGGGSPLSVCASGAPPVHAGPRMSSSPPNGVTTLTASEDERHWFRGFADHDLIKVDGGSRIHAFVETSEGVVLAGDFDYSSGVAAKNVARWNGVHMEPLGAGFDSTVFALAVFNGELIAGGKFLNSGGQPVNHIARWDGVSWQPLGDGTNGDVCALRVFDGDLYGGGRFDSAGSSPAAYIARWDGSTWSDVGGGMAPTSTAVYALAVYGNKLIAGGLFWGAGAVEVNNVAQWNGVSWASVGGGLEGGENSVRALSVYGTDLVAGGEFHVEGELGKPAHHVARWDGAEWSAFGWFDNEGVDDDVHALAVFDGDLVLGGDFQNGGYLGTVPAEHLVRWTGSGWESFAESPNAPVLALVAVDDELLAGGDFSGVVDDADEVNYVGCPAAWDSDRWHGFGQGVIPQVLAATWFDGKLIIGTDADVQAGDVRIDGVGQWDGHRWSPMGSLGGSVSDLTVYNGELIAGGSFGLGGGDGPQAIARWDTLSQSWQSLDPLSEPDDRVLTLGVWDGYLVAGGSFSHVGATYVNHIARWDGDLGVWSAFGAGLGTTYDEVYDLAVYQDELIAAGFFQVSGGLPVERVGRWDGAAWRSLGGGMDHTVRSLAVWGDLLVAGGWFTQAGGQPANYVASWDGVSWSELGGGTDNEVGPLEIYNGDLIVGGSFASAGGAPANYIARFTGTEWEPLGSGLDFGGPLQIQAAEDSLFIVGTFQLAGGFSSYGIARWVDYCPPEEVVFCDLQHQALGGLCLNLSPGGEQLELTPFGSSGQRGVAIDVNPPESDWRVQWDVPILPTEGSWLSVQAAGLRDEEPDQPLGSIHASVLSSGLGIDFDISGQDSLYYEAYLGGALTGTVLAADDTVRVSSWHGSCPMVASEHVVVEPNTLRVLAVAWGDTVEVTLPTAPSGILADSLRVMTGASSFGSWAVTDVSISGSGFVSVILGDESTGNVVVGVPAPATNPVSRLWLSSPWPNPMSGSALVEYSLPTRGAVRLGLYDLRGRKIRDLVTGTQEAGAHRVAWDGRDGRGARVGSGVYFLRLQVEGGERTSRVVFLR